MMLFVALGFVVLLLYQNWIEYSRPAQPAQPTTIAEQPAAPNTTLPQAGLPVAPRAATTTTAAVINPRSHHPAGEIITIETDMLHVKIDSQGGSIVEAELLQHAISSKQPDQPFTLFTRKGNEVFIAESGIIGRQGASYPNHHTRYQTAATEYRLEPDQTVLEVPLVWQSTNGVTYTKVFRFYPDSYEIDIEFQVNNATSSLWQGFLYAQLSRNQVAKEGGMGLMSAVPSFNGGALYTPENKYQKLSFEDMFDQDLNITTNSGWVAMIQHYFVSGLIPQGKGPLGFYTQADKQAAGPIYRIGYKQLLPVSAEAGELATLKTRLYVGPKEQERLKKQSEGFNLTVDYGWLTPISAPLFWVLKLIHKAVGNWGWAIVLLTVLIKLVFYPLSAASYKSMAKMKKVQPRLQTLKDRHGDDRAKMNQAMMEMYKKEKINPLGGCLPILIQIPVFIALYWVLLESVELRQAPFMLWINDLSIKDPYYILPLLMGGSMLAQHFLNPAPLDPLQKKIMMAMPVVFTVLFLSFPAGLVLYWLVNNVLSISQQWYINRSLGVLHSK